jgi:hypothetical protein
MTTQIDIEHPAATPSGTAPVAMQRGRHSDRIALARLRGERRWLVRDRDKAGLAPDHPALADGLVAELETGRIESVAFVVRSDVLWPLPLYDIAITTARRGWALGIPAARYWLITPEPQPLATLGAAVSAYAHERLEPEGITFIGSTYAHVQRGVVLLDPQDEHIHADRIVSLGSSGVCSTAVG